MNHLSNVVIFEGCCAQFQGMRISLSRSPWTVHDGLRLELSTDWGGGIYKQQLIHLRVHRQTTRSDEQSPSFKPAAKEAQHVKDARGYRPIIQTSTKAYASATVQSQAEPPMA